MALWTWTFLVLLVTAVLGLWLFAGYTFRIRPRYPMLLVTCHVVGALASVILFLALFVKWLHDPHTGHSYAPVVLWTSLIVILATFLSGLYFYFYYNARRRGLGYKLLVTHLVMAACSFVCALSSVAELSRPIHSQQMFPATGYNFHKHQSHRAAAGQFRSN